MHTIDHAKDNTIVVHNPGPLPIIDLNTLLPAQETVTSPTASSTPSWTVPFHRWNSP